MAESYSWVASITTQLDKLIVAIRASQRSSSALASSELRDSRKKVEVVLETSEQKFQVWTKTWLENASEGSDRAVSAGELWGDEGLRDIQKLLSSIQKNAQQIENELAKKDDRVSHFGWRRTLRSSLSKKNRAWIIRSRPLIDLAVQLSRSIDELWTYSEVAFDSLHGMFSRQIGPPQREMLIGKSLNARHGSLALYEACNQSKADYSLEVDLFGESLETSSKFRRRSSVSSKMSSGLFYHLFAANPEVSDTINGITIESIVRPGEADIKNTEAIEYIMNPEAIEFDIKRSDLAIYQSWPNLKSKSTVISIHSRTAYAPSYFRVPTPPVDLVRKGKMESLAQLLYKDRIAISLEERPMSQETRVQLAFKLVECGFYLLGTPWLASLSSKRLRRMNTSEGNPFVLEVQTLDLDDLYFEDPEALSERSQLFSIGVLLVEIALSDERNPHNIQDPDLRKSKILPMVEMSMGSLYCAATAFCLADRRSAPHFERPEKYRKPEESAWSSYLRDLLEDYHGQVYSR